MANNNFVLYTRLAVMLPEGEDLNEWLAVNTVDFFNQVSRNILMPFLHGRAMANCLKLSLSW